MQFTTLGKTNVTVSKLCFGTMSFGGDADEEMSAKMFHRCRDAGVNFFDCANIYVGGRSEEILGNLIRDCRDELVITTKAGFGQAQPGLSRRSIMRAMEESLKRLKTDRVDVYFCHYFDAQTPIDETLQALDDIVRQGMAVYIGLSNWAAWQIARAIGRGEMLGLTGIRVLQPMYNLAKRTAEIEILPLAQAEGLGVISYSPLGGGLLTGKYSRDKKDDQGRLSKSNVYVKRYKEDVNFEIAERLTAYAKEAGVHPATLAVAWVKTHPGITAPIIGARNLEQLEPSLAAGDYEMTGEERRHLTNFTPPVPVATSRDENREQA